MKKQEIKEIIKNYMESRGLESAPTLDGMTEILDEEGISNEEFYEAIEEIGKEKEKEGYELIWNFCKEYEAGCKRFVVNKYPNEVDFLDYIKKEDKKTQEKYIKKAKEFLKKKGYYQYSTEDLRTDGWLIWIYGEREGLASMCWDWDIVME